MGPPLSPGSATTRTRTVTWWSRSASGTKWVVTDISAPVGNYTHSPVLRATTVVACVPPGTTRRPRAAPRLRRPWTGPITTSTTGSGTPAAAGTTISTRWWRTAGTRWSPRSPSDQTDLAAPRVERPTGSSDGGTRIWYGYGRAGQGFTAYSLAPWTRNLYSKDAGVDVGGGAVHVAYAMVINGRKDRYYIWRHYTDVNATPTPTATPTVVALALPRPAAGRCLPRRCVLPLCHGSGQSGRH